MERKYNEVVESDMVYVYSLLDEKSKRYYACIEAIKLGHSGIKYIGELFDISEKTLQRGIEELKKEMACRKE
jgi:ABC-type Na+ transport system ATPase subunit NatA